MSIIYNVSFEKIYKSNKHYDNYLKSSQEMMDLFLDLPESIYNTELIAKKCSFLLRRRYPSIPKYKSSTQEEISEAKSVKLEDLKDPQKDEDRAKDPEWLVMLGVCTHLGCVPLEGTVLP